MLENLPVELVHDIIRLSLHKPTIWLDYHSNQAALLRLARLSRRWRSLVQPLIGESMWIETSRAWEAVEQRPRRLRRALDGLWRVMGSVPPAQIVGLRSLHLQGGVNVDLSALSALPNLQHLYISSATLAGDAVTLPRLTELTCIETEHVDGAAPTPLVSPRNLPALRYLAYVPTAHQQRLVEASIVDQLDVLVTFDPLQRQCSFHFDVRIIPPTCAVLVDSLWGEWWFPKAVLPRIAAQYSSLRIVDEAYGDEVTFFNLGVEERLVNLAEAIAELSPACKLERIYLPEEFKAPRFPEHLVDAIAAACEARNVDLVKEHHGRGHFGSLVSPHCLSMAKRQK